MNKRLYITMAALLFLSGLAIFLYPHINGQVLEKESSQAAEEFLNTIAIPTPSPIPNEKPEVVPTATPMLHADLYVAMAEYNKAIYYKYYKTNSEGRSFAKYGQIGLHQ